MSYRVVVTREDGQWLADVPDLEGAHTYASTLRKLDQYVREVIAMAADLPDDAMAGLDLSYEYHLGDDQLDARIQRIRKNREQVEQAQRELRDEIADALMSLTASGSIHLSQRDAAHLVGLSHQRVSQIAKEA
jgi:hypothetical protein